MEFRVSQQCLSVLKAGKFDAEQNTHKLVEVDSGKINPNVERIFTITELYLKSVTGKSGVLKIDKDDIVTNISKNFDILSLFSDMGEQCRPYY